MFNNTRIKQLETENRVLKNECAHNEKLTIKMATTDESHKIEIERLTTKHLDEVERIQSNIDTKISQKTNELKKEITKLTIENEGNKQKVSMYEKAFENLGFDVKDMKEILNKLVDGIVSKNEITVLSTGK